MTVTLDFPALFGWESIPAAAIFAVLYSPLFVVFLYKIIKEQRRVLFTMTLFCLSMFGVQFSMKLLLTILQFE